MNLFRTLAHRLKPRLLLPELRWCHIALEEHQVKAHYGDKASIQPGDLQDVMLRDTAVPWSGIGGQRRSHATPVEGLCGGEVRARGSGCVQRLQIR